jgi:molybdate transport system ATP-binding protein
MPQVASSPSRLAVLRRVTDPPAGPKPNLHQDYPSLRRGEGPRSVAPDSAYAALIISYGRSFDQRQAAIRRAFFVWPHPLSAADSLPSGSRMKPSNRRQPRPFLSLSNATFRLGDELVFESTSWVFHRHEHWAIVGANGSGKSLLADALRGRLPLIKGELRYHFRPPEGLAPEEAIGHVSFEERKSNLRGMVVQSRWNSLEDHSGLLARDFLSYERVVDINPYEVTDRHEKARPLFERRRRKAIGLLRIAPFLDRRLVTLSNGEMQLVQLARALCLPLRLLILDEPFIGLDVATRAHFHAVLERLMDTPLRVILIVTHLEDLPTHVTHLLYVAGREVVAAGPRAGLISKPRFERLLVSQPARKQTRRGATRAARHRRPASKRSAIHGSSSCNTELLRLRNVTVRYGNTTILRDLNWTIRAGESWALVGPNGSGKTTLLSLILGDNPQAYANDVTVFRKRRGGGESIWDIKKRIGWVSSEQQLYFDEGATCLAAVTSGFHDTAGLFRRPTSRQSAAARHWLAQFQMLDFADVPLFALSAGQQRMVLLARALVKKPQLLILDEPCQGLDSAHRDEFVQTVDKLAQKRQTTVIYVTHRNDEVPPSIRGVLRLEAGRGTVEAR